MIGCEDRVRNRLTGRIVAIFRAQAHVRPPGLPIMTIRSELDGLRARRLCCSQENRVVSGREIRASLGMDSRHAVVLSIRLKW